MDKLTLNLRPFKKRGQWTIEFDPSIVSLSDHKGKQVLAVPRDEAVRYIQLKRDLLRGWTISFELLYGMRSFTFACSKDDINKILSCLPQKSPAEMTHEVRLNAVAIILFGILLAIVPENICKICGIALALLGIVGGLISDRRIYLINGIVMFLIGILQLFLHGSVISRAIQTPFSMEILSAILGIIFVCWSIQQFSMLGPNAQLRVARLKHGIQTTTTPKCQKLIRKVAMCAMAGAIAMPAYSVILFFMMNSRSSILLTTSDIMICFILGVLSLLSALILLIRKNTTYIEAKITAQMLTVLILIVIWGIIDATSAQGFTGNIIKNGLHMFLKPYVWGSFLITIIIFNKLFSKAMDIELGEA